MLQRNANLVGIALIALTFGIVGLTKVVVTVLNQDSGSVTPEQLGLEDPSPSPQLSYDPHADEQQSIQTTRVAYLAVGCKVLTEDDANALFTIGLKNVYGATDVSKSSDLPLFNAKSDGIASATDAGACDSLSNNPQQLADLRKQVQSAKVELERLGQAVDESKKEEPPVK